MVVTIKTKNEASPIIDRITDNLEEISKLLKENKKLMEEFLKKSIEIE